MAGEPRPAQWRPEAANDDHGDPLAPTLAAAAIALADGRTAHLVIDPARHVRLRLACALEARSASAIVGEALDRYFSASPEIEQSIAEAIAEGALGLAERKPDR